MSETDNQNDGGLAARHAAALLAYLGVAAPVTARADHPALAWRRAGLFDITGRSDGPALVAPVPLTSAAQGALDALAAITGPGRLPVDGALLLGERARMLGLRRRGAASANGSCRLLHTHDGFIALNLARPSDRDAMPALLGEEASDWDEIARLAVLRSTDEMVARGRLLGLAIAADRDVPVPAAPFAVRQVAAPKRVNRASPLVVDLSALWAGPLAASLLRAIGGRVVKVESLYRPDGARGGDPRFFDLLNAGAQSVALDFADTADQRHLRRLIDAADIVIEGTRPRALEQLGIDAEGVAERGATWVSITGHGRDGEPANFVGFGDDAAVAGGLSFAMRRAWGEPLFAGDAIADPLTGITAALAAWASWQAGGCRIVSLALAQVVAHARGLGEAGDELPAWQAMAERDAAPMYALRAPAGRARPLGADTAAVLASL